jgi:superfamily II DNA or RNA helicase/tetratricopeptide (TPR) repeat protein
MADKAGGKKKEREKRIREERAQRLRRAEAENHYFSASMHYRSRNFAEARRSLQKAIMVQPNHLSAHQLLAQIALDEKNLPEALRVLQVIVKNWPEEIFACYYLGVVLMDLRKYDEAREAFQAFLAASGVRRSDAVVKDYRKNARSAIREVDRIAKQQLSVPLSHSSPANETADLFQLQPTPVPAKAVRGTGAGNLTGAARKASAVSLPLERRTAPIRMPDLRLAKPASSLGKPESPPAQSAAPPETPATPPNQPAAAVPETPLFDLSAFADPARRAGKPVVRFTFINEPLFAEMNRSGGGNPHAWQLWMEYHRIRLIREFDELLCLGHLRNIDQYWYQIETVSQVLRRFGGRVLLADEVGLGKTIEAGMVLKEYLLRGMVRKILVLTPPSLVSQWREELETKFGLDFITTEDPSYREGAEDFWRRHDRIIASLHTAKSRKNIDAITSIDYDLVIVDEAHGLRNRRTAGYRFVNEVRKKFILLLSATPVQNNLLELYNLITLLKPGLLSTEAAFKKEYVKRGSLRTPNHPDKLRHLLREVMIRNTRSLVDVKLPKRFATTLYIPPLPHEKEQYEQASRFCRDFCTARGQSSLWTVQNLQMAAGSSPLALRESVLHLLEKSEGISTAEAGRLRDLAECLRGGEGTSKGDQLLQLLKAREDKKIVFVKYLKTLDYLSGLLNSAGIPFAVFGGGMTGPQKDQAIARFREEVPVLLSTETGGEGRNLQFCNTLINYDIPWNPMRLEQRIGRLHRIGQRRDVFVFNLCLAGSIEDHMMRILDDKIHMFELVVGEIDTILGNLDSERDFGSVILEMWVRGADEAQRRASFERFGEEIIEARKLYEKTRALDNVLFGEDYEV